MRAIPADELARILSETGHWRFRVEAQRPGDAAWTNLSDGEYGDWTLAIESDGETPDSPATGVTVRFLARDGADALSPGMSASAFNRVAGLLRPLLYPGRRLRLFAANVAAPADAPLWRPWWTLIEVEDLDVVPGEVLVKCQTLDAKLEATWMTVEEEGGAEDPGRPVEDEIRDILERWAPWALPLRVVGNPDWSIGPYPRGKASVGQLVRSLAQRNAWDLRWQWSEADGAHALTLSLPPRDKDEPDLVLHASQVHESPSVALSRRDVRNDFATDYRNEAGEVVTATRENAASVADYGRRALVFDETGPESPIRRASQADALNAYADSDLSEPLTDRRVVLPFLPWLELHDVLEIGADGEQYDFPGLWAVTSIAHRVTATEGPSTEVGLRGGSPVGMYYAWLARGGAQVADPDTEARIVVQEIRREADRTIYGITHRNALTAGVRVYRTVRLVPYDGYPWPTSVADLFLALTDEAEFAIPHPLLNHITFLQVEPVQANGDGGPIHRFQIFGTRELIILPPGPPVVHPPLPPPTGVTVARQAAGDCASGESAVHRLTWDGAGVVRYRDPSGAWLRPPGAPISFDDPQPFDVPVLGGGYVIDEAAGTPTELAYRVTRQGVSGTQASTEVTITEPLRRCDGGGGGAVTIDGQMEAEDETGSCLVRDTLAWSAGGYDPALHAVQYQLLDAAGGARSSWLDAPAGVAAGVLTLDVHGGQRSVKLEPVAPTDELVEYGARLRVVLKASGAVVVLGPDLSLRYVVEACA